MKFEKFFDWIQKQLLYHPELNFNTIKLFINQFIECLSNNEYKRLKLQIQVIKSLTNKQITIDKFVLDNDIKNYDKELDVIKNGN